jgi:hypothetical protein
MSRFNTEFRRFFSRFVLGSAILLVLVSPLLYFNIFIDPFGIFFDHNEFVYYTNENNKRAGKIRYILKYPDRFDSFIFGSSRVNFVNCDRCSDGKFFNMTYSGGSPRDHLHDLRMMIKGGIKVNKVIIGADFLSFFKPDMIDEMKMLRTPYPVTIDEYYHFYKQYILNIPQKELFLANLINYDTNRQQPIGNGQFYSATWDSSINTNPSGHIRLNSFRSPVSHYLSRQEFQKGLDYLKELIHFLEKQHIEYTLFIHPTNVTTYLNINLPTYLILLENLAQITGFYDFSGLNSICINHLNFYESSHYRLQTGDLIIDRLYNRKNQELPADFGILVNKKNIRKHIEQHLTWIDDYFGSISYDQSSWVKSSVHPADIISERCDTPVHKIDELNYGPEMNKIRIISAPYIRLTVRKPCKATEIPVVFTNQQVLYHKNDKKADIIRSSPLRKTGSGEWELMVPVQLLDTGFQHLSVAYMDTISGKFTLSHGIFKIRVLHEREYPAALKSEENINGRNLQNIQFQLTLANGTAINGDRYTLSDPWLNLEGYAVDATTKQPVKNLLVLVNGNPYPILFQRETNYLEEKFNCPESRYAGWSTVIPIPGSEEETMIEFAVLSDDLKFIYKTGRNLTVSRQFASDTTILRGLKKMPSSTQFWIDRINNVKTGTEIQHQITGAMINLSGWAVDHAAGKTARKIYIRVGNKLFNTSYELPRQDVAEHYKNPAYARCGWTTEIPVAQINSGTYLINLLVVTHDGKAYYSVNQGTKVIIP